MMGWHGGGMNGFAWLGMGLFWLVLVGLIVWLIVRLLPEKSPRPSHTPAMGVTSTSSASAPALTILDARLAHGEVDLETYRTIRRTLVEGREAKD